MNWSIFDEKSNFNKLPFLIREMHSYNENIWQVDIVMLLEEILLLLN